MPQPQPQPPPLPQLETRSLVKGYADQIRFKAECLTAFTPGGDNFHELRRDESALAALKEINVLLNEALALLPTTR